MLPDGRIIVVKKIVPVQVQVVVTVFLRRPGDIDHLHIAGDVVRAEVMANRDGSIGDAFVGGDLRASSLAAGVDRGFDGMFGTDDDRFVFPGPGHPSGRIGRIHVQGQLVGTPEPGDRFGIVARQIDAFFSSTTGDLPLRRGPSNDDMLIGTTGDVRLRELVPTAPAPPAPPGGGGFEP